MIFLFVIYKVEKRVRGKKDFLIIVVREVGTDIERAGG